MARPTKKPDIEWREPPPVTRKEQGKWEKLLEPLLKRPGQWAMIATKATPELASSQAQNLQQRNVLIPKPDDDWEFVSRGPEVFAIYRKKAKSAARIRRTRTKG